MLGLATELFLMLGLAAVSCKSSTWMLNMKVMSRPWGRMSNMRAMSRPWEKITSAKSTDIKGEIVGRLPSLRLVILL